MGYTFFAIGCYIVMRAVQVLFEEQQERKWYKILIKCVTVITLYAGLASLVIYYKEIPLLGFDPSQ